MTDHMKAQAMEDLHYSGYLKIPSNCTCLKACAILRKFQILLIVNM